MVDKEKVGDVFWGGLDYICKFLAGQTQIHYCLMLRLIAQLYCRKLTFVQCFAYEADPPPPTAGDNN